LVESEKDVGFFRYNQSKRRKSSVSNLEKKKGKTLHPVHSCPNYLTRLAEFENTNFRPSDGVKARIKMRDKFFMQQFRVLQKSFGSYFDRRNSEAFFIRILRPDLNDQNVVRPSLFYIILMWVYFF
jgi:hypothetical protein